MTDFTKLAAEVRSSEQLPKDGRNALPQLSRLEQLLRQTLPNISYEIHCRQPTDFTEYTYFEAFGCLNLTTQSMEINTRIILHASTYTKGQNNTAQNIIDTLQDKWLPDGELQIKDAGKVMFFPGGNLNWIVNMDNMNRAVFDENWMIKPHPVTAPDYLAELRRQFTIRNLYEPTISGIALLKQASQVGFTTASELGIVAMCLGIPSRDFTRFQFEHHGAMFPIYYAIRKSLETASPASPASILSRLMQCPWSGVIPLNTPNDEALHRMNEFKEKAIAYRALYRPLIRNAHESPILRREKQGRP